MKLRIRDNSVRLRLTQTEVATLREQGLVSACTAFPGGHEFRYVVESSPASVRPGAFYADNAITVRLPESEVLGWASSEQVSIVGEQQYYDGGVLSILVEKDFACLAPRDDEDETDMYPHPEAESGDASC